MAILNVKSFPDSLYERIRALAEREHRSLAQQVIHLLSAAVESDEPLSILELRGLGKELWRETGAAAHVKDERESWNEIHDFPGDNDG